MLVCHITPHKLDYGLKQKVLSTVKLIHKNGLRQHSSVCTPETINSFLHHGFRTNRKNQYTAKVVEAAILYFEVDEKYLKPGCDGIGHFYCKANPKPIKWELINR